MDSQRERIAAFVQLASEELEVATWLVVKAPRQSAYLAQQAAEKSLKAYLTFHEIEFPFIHNLEKLVDLCAGQEEPFADIKLLAQQLTPYAVELRYDAEFWPSREAAQEAMDAAVTIRDFVIDRLPASVSA